MLKDLFYKLNKKTNEPTKKGTYKDSEPVMTKCPNCKNLLFTKELIRNVHVCPKCDYHFPVTSDERLDALLDKDSKQLLFTNITSKNPLNFPNYVSKLENDKRKTGLNEALRVAHGKIDSKEVVVAVMDTRVRMGSMGSAVGEMLAQAFNYATDRDLPVVVFTASGGARMQEGILSLMQMAKVSVAVKRHSNKGLLYVSYMTHPTTGGVSASFASVGDINLAESGALIGFAGRRVIEETIKEKLPNDFQTAEFLIDHGQLDKVVNRTEMRSLLAQILRLHE